MNMSEHHTKPQLMAFAAQKAKESHQRWSETREQVFSALLDVEQPISAYDLAAKVAGMFSRQVNAMSVYRALDALCAMGLAVRVESLNAYLPCKHMEEDAHQHVVLVCDACGNADEIEDSGVSNKLERDAKSHGFKTSRQILELHGTCGKCTDE